jgi:glycosyltransferase involved in cell wall biosynthesis
MQKINLLYIVTKLELGGAQKQLLSLIRCLDKQRFNIFLFTAKRGMLFEEAQSLPGIKFKPSAFLERSLNPFLDLLALIEISRYIKKNRIEVVHTHSSKAGILGRWAARLCGVKFILHTVHGWSFNEYQPVLKNRLFVWLERITANFTDRIIVVSEYDRKKGLVNRIGCPDKYILIRYGIDYSDFIKTEDGVRRELGIGFKDLLVGNISCLKPQKSPQDFVRLAYLTREVVPDAMFLLVGDGVLRSRLERLIKELGLEDRVMLLGWRRDISRLLCAMDVLTLTSLWEGLPVTCLEAMVSSRAVIATNTGGIQEVVIEGQTGFLVPCKDMEAMSQKLICLLKDRGLREKIGQNAKENLGLNFIKENMVKRHEYLYVGLNQKGGHTNAA